MQAIRILIKGQVQGLGFRPFVYRLATKLALKGTVSNTKAGVEIQLEGNKTNAFVAALKSAPPNLAIISEMHVAKAKLRNFKTFTIAESVAAGALGTDSALDVLPDLVICPECAAEIADEENRRFGYALTNCTQCGPRYSIMQGLPYDRPRTTMRKFRMCPNCQREYDDPVDRRFHAQPNCCPVCGPKVSLLHANGTPFDEVNPIETASRMLLDGKILAVKGLGGFHLACDATNEVAVAELRRRKDRPDKPLAVMCLNLATARRFCQIDAASALLLDDLARPIVLMPKVQGGEGLRIAPQAAPGLNQAGLMLAYTPLQCLLFRPVDAGALQALVMTSANLKDEPVISELPELTAKLGSVVDYILTHVRDIANRCDDSVVQAADCPPHAAGSGKRKTANPTAETCRLFVRRAKGYAPSPIVLDPKKYKMKPILACGGELKNTFALAAGNRVYVSPHIGDMENAEGLQFYEQTLETYRRFYNIRPEIVAVDLHADYMATRFGENLALKSHRPVVRVQHHHAHIASVIAEHNLPEPVLGIALDGTGLGADARIWGCEMLLAWRGKYERLGHLRYLPLIGGEATILEPMRIAASYLIYLLGEAAFSALPGMDEHRNLLVQLGGDTNVIFTSSTGRLFDAVSALLGICRKATYDGHAPSLLEAAADPRERGSFFQSSDIATGASGMLLVDPKRWLIELAAGVQAGVAPGKLSRRFHNTFIAAMTAAARTLAKQHKVKSVCLAGGSFQNRILLHGLTQSLTGARLAVYTNHAVPVNDGGLSFGQAIVAGAQNKI